MEKDMNMYGLILEDFRWKNFVIWSWDEGDINYQRFIEKKATVKGLGKYSGIFRWRKRSGKCVGEVWVGSSMMTLVFLEIFWEREIAYWASCVHSPGCILRFFSSSRQPDAWGPLGLHDALPLVGATWPSLGFFWVNVRERARARGKDGLAGDTTRAQEDFFIFLNLNMEDIFISQKRKIKETTTLADNNFVRG